LGDRRAGRLPRIRYVLSLGLTGSSPSESGSWTPKRVSHLVASYGFMDFQVWDFPGQLEYFESAFDLEDIFGSLGALVWVSGKRIRYILSLGLTGSSPSESGSWTPKRVSHLVF
jgi:hypothetical protein